MIDLWLEKEYLIANEQPHSKHSFVNAAFYKNTILKPYNYDLKINAKDEGFSTMFYKFKFFLPSETFLFRL